MRLIKETRSGGTSHYTLEPEETSDFGQPTAGFRAFVRALSWRPVVAAVSLGQFQHRVERAFASGHSRN